MFRTFQVCRVSSDGIEEPSNESRHGKKERGGENWVPITWMDGKFIELRGYGLCPLLSWNFEVPKKNDL